MEKRHAILLRLDERMLNILLREGAMLRCMAGVPADAKFLGAYSDFVTQSIAVAFEHPSFPVTEPGEEAPRRPVAFEIIEHPGEALGMSIPTRMGNGPILLEEESGA